METVQNIAIKMQECRDKAKAFWAGAYDKDYDKNMEPFKNLIVGHAIYSKKSILESALNLCQDESIRKNYLAVTFILASAFDMIENSDKIK